MSNKNRAIFKINAPWIILDYNIKLNTPGIIRNKEAVLIPQETALELQKYFYQSHKIDDSYRVAAIVIDPGHGGKDPGASMWHTINGKKVNIIEKDIVLTISLLLYKMLKKHYPDKSVLLTRKNDTFIALEERPEIANNLITGQNEAVIYISIHANASPNKKAKGFEVWYLSPSYSRELIEFNTSAYEYSEVISILNTMKEEELTWESILLAQEILSSLEKNVGDTTNNRGLKKGEWLVVKKAKMPSILIEVGFISNYEEASCLIDKTYLQKICNAIYNGVNQFIQKFEKSKGFTE